MANRTGAGGNINDFLFGETLDVAVDFILDDEEFEDVFDTEVHSAVREISNHDVLLSCAKCEKKYKTQAGLSRHIKTKHDNSKPPARPFDRAVIVMLINQAKEDLANDGCYPADYRSAISNYVLDEENNDNLRKQLLQLYIKLCKHSDAEKFYAEFYETVVMNAEKHFQNLEFPMCALIATRLGDKILSHYKKPTEQPSAAKKISEQEVGSLQYLAGYVVHSIVRKLHQALHSGNKSRNAMDMISFLNSLRMEDISSQRQIRCQTRGGLWGVNADCIQLFTLIEEEFRVATETGHISTIDCHKLTCQLTGKLDVISAFNAMEQGSHCNMENETRINLLEKLIQLYLRVRAFSFAKSKSQLHFQKAKALRKDLKTKSDTS